MQVGGVEFPITNPFTLSGGLTSSGKFVTSAKGGLAPVKQPVPGGVIGFTGYTWLAEFFGSEALKLYAAIELASNPSNLLGEPVNLPIKLHMFNSVLGNNCYLGSEKEPSSWQLITGTTSPPKPNMPITGSAGSSSLTGNGVTDVTGGTYVDNSFYAPGASGCVLTLFGFPPENIDEEINEVNELPSEEGHNTVELDFKSESVSVELVYP